MNELSWLIFFAGIVESTKGFFMFLTFVSFIIFGVLLVSKVISIFNLLDNSDVAYESFDEKVNYGLKIMICSVLFFGLIGNLIPNKSTIIMIAASEFVEKTIQNSEVKNVIAPGSELIKTWLEKEKLKMLNEMTSEEKKK